MPGALLLLAAVTVALPPFNVERAAGLLSQRVPDIIGAGMQRAQCAEPMAPARMSTTALADFAQCTEHAACLGQVGRRLGFDFVVSGHIVKLDSDLTVLLTVFDVHLNKVTKHLEQHYDGALSGLEAAMQGQVPELCKAINPGWKDPNAPKNLDDELSFQTPKEAEQAEKAPPAPPPPPRPASDGSDDLGSLMDDSTSKPAAAPSATAPPVVALNQPPPVVGVTVPPPVVTIAQPVTGGTAPPPVANATQLATTSAAPSPPVLDVAQPPTVVASPAATMTPSVIPPASPAPGTAPPADSPPLVVASTPSGSAPAKAPATEPPADLTLGLPDFEAPTASPPVATQPPPPIEKQPEPAVVAAPPKVETPKIEIVPPTPTGEAAANLSAAKATPSRRVPWGLITGGAAVVVMATGIGLGASSQSIWGGDHSTLVAGVSEHSISHQQALSANRLAVAADVMFAIGAAAGIGAGVLIYVNGLGVGGHF